MSVSDDRFYQREWQLKIDERRLESFELTLMLRALMRVVTTEQLRYASKVCEECGIEFNKTIPGRKPRAGA